MYCEKLELRLHLQESIMRVKPLAFISAKHAAQSYLEVKPNFIQVAAGPLSMPQKVMMQ
jgi:hypothetical protein